MHKCIYDQLYICCLSFSYSSWNFTFNWKIVIILEVIKFKPMFKETYVRVSFYNDLKNLISSYSSIKFFHLSMHSIFVVQL